MTVSAGLHVLAGGPVMRLSTLVVAAALVAVGAYALAGQPRGLGVLLGASFAVQYGLHLLFVAGTPADEIAPQVIHDGHTSGFGMFFVHVVAALASGWWLERGESALASFLDLATLLATAYLARLWPRLLILLLPYEPVTAPAPADSTPRPVTALLAATVTRRGPPLSFSVL
ncbi:hypothetical protein [Sinosporangium siamense]|uniref:Uncharacterized protein n=1 Tax=Sinosporangium siamense TaxID=1367973 RepID=A0A919V783_9ACTN|nr:hypothetical protein [Sinosporangium siamense]GII94845.1 hypothetical protein Ssi02_50760 [Sinosporangium siamense]